MTKQVKLAKILWQYRLSLPYHDYKPHMSCNKTDECDAGFKCFLLSRCKQTHATSNSLHYTSIWVRDLLGKANDCNWKSRLGCTTNWSKCDLADQKRTQCAVHPSFALTPKCAYEEYSLLNCFNMVLKHGILGEW